VAATLTESFAEQLALMRSEQDAKKTRQTRQLSKI
jgi:hypothetical protein